MSRTVSPSVGLVVEMCAESADSSVETRPPRIDYNGEELAAVLYYLAEIDSPLLDEIVKRLHCAATTRFGPRWRELMPRSRHHVS
jgi:hypothetical protein